MSRESLGFVRLALGKNLQGILPETDLPGSQEALWEKQGKATGLASEAEPNSDVWKEHCPKPD